MLNSFATSLSTYREEFINEIMKYLGIYIGWRCPEFKHDCQRVGSASKCFCGHFLGEHAKFNGKKTI